MTAGSVGAYVSGPGEGKNLPLIGILKTSGEQTAGSFEIVEYHGPIQPPPHVHHEHEEMFYILDGDFTFTLGTDEMEVVVGSLVFIPRGTRHGFKAGPGAKALLLTVPSGLEGFFEELGTGLAAGQSNEEMRAALAGKYDSFPAAD